VMDDFFWIYVIGGLPYVLFTRALQHSPRSDRRQAAFVILKIVRHLWKSHGGLLAVGVLAALGAEVALPTGAPFMVRAFFASGWPLFVWNVVSRFDGPDFDRYDKSAMLGLGVKLFYVPLMTVFFSDQFPHLVTNYEWIMGPDFHLDKVTIKNVHDVAYTIVFSVDVGLAWCGYAISSRWIKNTIFTTEPTFFGWSMALLCYPPINQTQGHYFGSPSENAFFSLPSPFAVKVFAIASILSFSVYTSATVMFGLRFSNLTHRGIVTTGPYALIRHPAYASKNFSWWCVMLPPVIWEVWTQKNATPLLGVVGMVVQSTIYYWRAITEERHLMRDEEYRRYMKKVPYRFIPGVL
jgi:protein-S-isoprenylcysteine O-methyltransferase Ste14